MTTHTHFPALSPRATETTVFPPTPPRDVGAAVFAALTTENKASLAEYIRIARESLADDQGDDWLCIIEQHYFEPAGHGDRIKRVTRKDLLETCINLAWVKPSAGQDWPRLLNPFEDDWRRISALFDAAEAGELKAKPSILRDAYALNMVNA